MTRYRTTPRSALVQSAVPVVFTLLMGLVLVRPLLLGFAVGAAGALLVLGPSYAMVRRRWLEVRDEGLVVQRDKYRLVVPWEEITGVRRRRHQLLMVVDELVVSGATVELVDSRGRPSKRPAGLSEHPALSSVFISAFDPHWRDGPVGARLSELVSES